MTLPETWAARVAAWRESGQGAIAFSAGKDFHPSSLFYWAKKLRTLPVDAPKRDVRLARVVTTPSPALPIEPGPALVITVGDARVEARPGSDLAALCAVVRVLREAR